MVKASSPTVKAIFILDSDGNRVCAKYYDKSYPTAKDQLALEKKLYLKTKNSNPRLEAEIILIDNIVSVYRSGSDVTMHVIGSAHESELILLSVLDATFEAASSLLKGRMDRHVILDNIELVLLTFDEVVDGGIILELDTPSISNRVLMRGIDNEVPIGELTISQVRFHESKVPDVVALVQKFYFVFPLCSIAQAFASAREQFSRSFRS